MKPDAMLLATNTEHPSEYFYKAVQESESQLHAIILARQTEQDFL